MSPGKKKADREKKVGEEEMQGKEGEGIAESILEGLGGLIPGLGGLVKSLAKSEAFRERLQAIDEEIKEKLRTEPLKRVEVDAGVGGRPAVRGIPGRPLSARKPAVEKRKAPPTVKAEEVDSKEFPVDIFDEEDHLYVIAEMPGLAKEDIRLDLQGDQLALSAERGRRKYYQVVNLPSKATSVKEVAYRQGILEIRVEKG